MLYQMVRPEVFDGFLGNDGIVESLKQFVSVDSKSRPHAYLFVGDSGCGKTTLARIYAKALGCDGVDLVELNAANTRGIDTVRDIVNSCSFAPLMSSCKVYVFDECHQLTDAAQEALLKVIEDTPDKAYFIFCTTDPNGLIKTIRNRCATYEVQRLRPPDMKILLTAINEGMGYNLSEEVIKKIVSHSDGCSREALVTLEKVATVPAEKIDEVISSISESEKDVIELCRELISKRDTRWRKCIDIYSKLKTSDSEAVRRQVLGYLKECLIKEQVVTDAFRFVSMIEAFQGSTFYGGAPILLSQIFNACMVE